MKGKNMEGNAIVDFKGDKLEVGEIIGCIYIYNGNATIKKAKLEGVKDGMLVVSRTNGKGKVFTTYRHPDQAFKLYRPAQVV